MVSDQEIWRIGAYQKGEERGIIRRGERQGII